MRGSAWVDGDSGRRRHGDDCWSGRRFLLRRASGVRGFSCGPRVANGFGAAAGSEDHEEHHEDEGGSGSEPEPERGAAARHRESRIGLVCRRRRRTVGDGLLGSRTRRGPTERQRCRDQRAWRDLAGPCDGLRRLRIPASAVRAASRSTRISAAVW